MTDESRAAAPEARAPDAPSERERVAAAIKQAWVAFPNQQDEGEPDVWVFMADAALRAAPVAADARPEAGEPSEDDQEHAADDADIFDGCEHIEDGICAECLRERRAARARPADAGASGREVDELANLIWMLNGDNKMGAGRLAEHLIDLGYRAATPPGAASGTREGLMARIGAELDRAYAKHGRDPWSRHEFYAILLEEVEEVWDAVKRDLPQEEVEKELVQVAAMCFRYYETRPR